MKKNEDFPFLSSPEFIFHSKESIDVSTEKPRGVNMCALFSHLPLKLDRRHCITNKMLQRAPCIDQNRDRSASAGFFDIM